MKLTNSLPKPTLSFDSTIIHLIEQQNYPDAKKLLVSSTLANDIFFTKDNVFNYLLSKIQNYHIFFKDNKYLFYLDLFLEIIQNPFFVFNSENIRNCVRLLPQNFKYHNQIIRKIKKQGLVKKLSILEKTNLLLIISEYYYHKNTKSNYLKYSQLFEKNDFIDCQKYLINNFEDYFNNCLFSLNSTTEHSSKIKQFKEEVLIQKTYSYQHPKTFEQPPQSQNLLGEDIKYVNMITPLWDFYIRQKKVKCGHSCLFKNYKKFFIFFSQYIKPHTPCNNNAKIISFLKKIQQKYNLSSISWDNRFFYEKNFNSIKDNIELSIKKSLKIFKLKDLHTLHLQFCSPHHYIYDGLYHNWCNFDIYTNIHVIQMNHHGFTDYKSTFIHEISHFIQFQTNNKNCFKHPSFLKLKDILYLHKERDLFFDKLQILKNHSHFSKLITFIDNSLHYSVPKFTRQLNLFLNYFTNFFSQKDFLLNLFLEYKKNKYKNSTQYLLWQESAVKDEIPTNYFNQDHEIHSRLNEILSQYKPALCQIPQYLTIQSVPFLKIKDDLIQFNKYLINNLKSP